jgi:exopolyphosphatase/guanosine-5'-triphosphate,3'-diphosphate pyrophosphatase
MYLILNGDLQPFRAHEVRTIANIARYHRKSFPSRATPASRPCPSRCVALSRWGGAAAPADGLDRTNCSVVQDVTTRTRLQSVEVLVDSLGDAELELGRPPRAPSFLSGVFHRTIAFKQLD